MIPELARLFEPFAGLSLSKAENALYKSFRYKESELVSCSDNFSGDQEEVVLALSDKGRPSGIISLVIRENHNKPTPPKSYVRLDLIIVDKKYRNLGVGRLLMVCSLIFILKTRESQVYSVSCLAAHETVEKFLRELTFEEKHGREKNFWQGTLNLEKNSEVLLGAYLRKAEKCLQWTAYQLNKTNPLQR